jgi:hypothetical protein
LYCANISEFNLFYTGRRFGKPNPMEKKVWKLGGTLFVTDVMKCRHHTSSGATPW